MTCWRQRTHRNKRAERSMAVLGADSQRCWTRSPQRCNTAAAPPSSARCRVWRGRRCYAKRDRCRTRLLRHRCRCTAHLLCASRPVRPKGRSWSRPTALRARPPDLTRRRLPGRPRAARQANLIRLRQPSTAPRTDTSNQETNIIGIWTRVRTGVHTAGRRVRRQAARRIAVAAGVPRQGPRVAVPQRKFAIGRSGDVSTAQRCVNQSATEVAPLV